MQPLSRAFNDLSTQEIWQVRLADPESQEALWLKFRRFSSRTGFRSAGEIMAFQFQRKESGECIKTLFKESHDINEYQIQEGVAGRIPKFQLAKVTFDDSGTQGEIRSKGKSLSWNLQVDAKIIHELQRESRWNQLREVSQIDTYFTGTTEVDGVKKTWKSAPGIRSYQKSHQLPAHWVWAHSDRLIDESGRLTDSVFEGRAYRNRLTRSILAPEINHFYFFYQGQEYRFQSILDSLRSHSKISFNDWEFRAERGDLSFRGRARAESRDFVSYGFQDTAENTLYTSFTAMSDLTVHVYRNGKLESTLNSQGLGALEMVGTEKNPYVPLSF